MVFNRFRPHMRADKKTMEQLETIKDAIEELASEKEKRPAAYPVTRSQLKGDMKQRIKLLEQQLLEQNLAVLSQNERVIQQTKLIEAKLSILLSNDVEEPEEIFQGSYEVNCGGTVWRVSGYTSIEPDAAFVYFPGLNWGPTSMDGGYRFTYTKEKVISAIVPCYNESGSDLDRTIRSLYRQRVPPGWRIEVVIVMDGADHMDPSMCKFLANMFGLKVNSQDPETDPFLLLPGAETIIVDACDEDQASTRTPAVEGTVGGYSLVVKKHNHRKANSQMWWLGPHGSILDCKYSLATDCGTVFARTATLHLIRRLDAEPNLHAVTGFQRIMTSEMQGDGSWEYLHNPFAFLLRMVQRFEFEVDHISFKSVYDTLGCMHVIPGPCGLFRYKAMGTLKEGLMHQYFQLFQKSSKGLIVGNVELVEDRIPGTLLSFPVKDAKSLAVMPPEGWPRTGFVHDAIFYIEAEKPLSQLVKQRRRWLNGTFATYIWIIAEGLITNSNQDPVSKFLSWWLVVINIIQGTVVRLFGPALLIVWMFRFGLFLPDLVTDPKSIFDPDLSLVDVEIEEGRLPYGVAFGGLYFLLYVAFVVGHTPRAKPVANNDLKIVRYTEPTSYCHDSASAYRAWLFQPVLWINFIVVCLFIINTIGIISTLGWSGTPLVVRILICICFAPFLMGICDGIVRRDVRCLGGMLYSAPFALPLMIWFTVWLPAYATTRLSDLTWGNREGHELDESSKALKRAKSGQKVALVLIGFNTFVSVTVILLMQFFGSTFPIFVMAYTLVLSMTFVISLADLIWRFISCHHCFNSTSDDSEVEDDVDVYYDLDNLDKKKESVTPPVSPPESDNDDSEGEGTYAGMVDDGIAQKEEMAAVPEYIVEIEMVAVPQSLNSFSRKKRWLSRILEKETVAVPESSLKK